MLLPIVRAQWTSAFLLVFAYAGFALFLFGFFPLKYHGGDEASWEDLPDRIDGFPVDAKKLYARNRSRIVLMVIDALRYDFVNSEHMPFTAGLVKSGDACLYKAHAEPPTVTMPRIKAMTTGSISNFIDVALNFGSSAVTEDSFLNQAKKNGKTAVFYGDDTWVKLFPNIFSRSEGTTSFYVTDYIEVDLNVTRNLPKELNTAHSDWDIMILHYLGLDHIGHLEGPTSPKVLPKMLEMDKIVKTIIEFSKNTKDDVIFVLCGDHGMKDSGSHGGASYSEVTVPLVFSHKKKCPQKMGQDVDQIDIAPTLSYILGIPIPSSSTGQILTQALSDDAGDFSTEKSLYTLYYNAKMNAEALIKILGEDEARNKECFKRYLTAVKNHGDWLRTSKTNPTLSKTASTYYKDSMMNMAHYLTKSLVEFDMYAIVLGIILVCQTLITQGLLTFITYKTEESGNFNRSYGFKQNSMFSRVILIICVVVACNFIFKVLCGVSQTNSSLCRAHPVSVSTIVAITAIVVTNAVIIQNIRNNLPTMGEITDFNIIELFLTICTILYPLTYAGTSFIEEEHQTWYFFWSSLTVLIFAYTIRILMDYYKKKSENATEVQDKESLSSKMDQTAKRLLPQWLLLMIIHRFLRTLNQTGDKWAFLPDTGDWLNKDEHIEMLSLLAIAALLSTVIICQKNLLMTIVPYKTNCCLIFGCVLCILLYRTTTNAILLPVIGHISINEIYVVRIFWMLLLAMVVVEVLSSKKHFTEEFYASHNYDRGSLDKTSHTGYLGEINAFIPKRDYSSIGAESGFLLSVQTGVSLKMKLLTSRMIVCLNMMLLICSLYLRPHNLILVPTICMTSNLVNVVLDFKFESRGTLKTKSIRKNIFCKTLIHFWIGSVFYFYQGNSNSLASIDLGSGYIGLESYIPPIVALQMGIHTYAGPLLSGLLLFTNLIQQDKDWETFLKHLRECLCILTPLRTYPLLVYMIICTLLRYHLFVWSVFSPKLLYEFTLTFFSLSAMLLLMVFCYSINVQEKIFMKHISNRKIKANA